MIVKKALFSTLFVALFILSGCSNPSSSDSNRNGIVGEWEAVEMQTGSSSSDLADVPVTGFTIELFSNGEFEFSDGTSGTYSNGTMNISQAGVEIPYAEYELDGDQLIVTVGQEGTAITVYVMEKVGGNGGDVNLSQLEGTWEAVKAVYTENGYTEEYEFEPGEITVTFQGGNFTIVEIDPYYGDEYTETVSYTVSGNNLIIEGESQQIVELTSSTLILRGPYEGETEVTTFRKI
ncbi:lipocalin family protein [Chitinispirillales bacterium ANBcel5]|uniref:lipocalin family protein n=1 Tax=Cellulosispirillum alkaliphilum TaxID=3039283 RepID=UPI002A526B25|nr:lipocalin family protein [Chitinispirillales bacterium ANBcel5]